MNFLGLISHFFIFFFYFLTQKSTSISDFCAQSFWSKILNSSSVFYVYVQSTIFWVPLFLNFLRLIFHFLLFLVNRITKYWPAFSHNFPENPEPWNNCHKKNNYWVFWKKIIWWTGSSHTGSYDEFIIGGCLWETHHNMINST